jgi:hypothetical protein
MNATSGEGPIMRSIPNLSRVLIEEEKMEAKEEAQRMDSELILYQTSLPSLRHARPCAGHPRFEAEPDQRR